MNFFHLETKVVSRGAGRSVIAAAAYASCSRLYNDYDGLTHDYTRKQGCLYSEVFLPQYAPEEWKDRQVLWEAVESVEKTKDSRLARELVVALPSDLSLDDWKGMLERFIREQGTDLGMCADVNIHDPYPPGHNPHSHILFTMRPLDEHGKWQNIPGGILANGRQRPRKNTFASVAAKNVVLSLMSSKLPKHKAGRNNICISLGRKRSI